MVELYWRQVRPWQGREIGRPLSQHTGARAAVLERVKEAQEEYGGRLDRIRREEDGWSALISRVDGTVRKDPLPRLQVVGGSLFRFLYGDVEGRGAAATITLHAGISYCFRAFHPLVIELVRSAWTRFVRRMNPDLLGEAVELGEFLFGAPRAALGALQGPLRQVQQDLCFYCSRRLDERCHVDHFIPWSRYPVDLGHNFVLAHDRCNGAKGDHLAAVRHLDRWSRRNQVHAYELRLLFETAGFPSNMAISTRVTRWAYGQVGERGGSVWISGTQLEPLEPGWEAFLG